MNSKSDIDINENTLRNRGDVLDILLIDRTKYKPSRPVNIIWATDSYGECGRDYSPKKQMKRMQITGVNGKLIQPRASKSKEVQKHRTKEKAEVFTPLKVVKEMNIAIDWAGKNWPVDKNNWIEYISERRLEITCGEAPFIASRYNPTANTGAVIALKNRVGFLDRKLQTVSKFVDNKKDWLEYAELALKASYGYEWQGDNLLIARENILQTMDDFYEDFCKNVLNLKSRTKLTNAELEGFAEIISWNIWQMDGLKYVRPMSCRQTTLKAHEIQKDQLGLFADGRPKKQKIDCEGCRSDDPFKHTGQYARIMDWQKGRTVRFVDLLKQEGSA